jgi:hypothetical protein
MAQQETFVPGKRIPPAMNPGQRNQRAQRIEFEIESQIGLPYLEGGLCALALSKRTMRFTMDTWPVWFLFR